MTPKTITQAGPATVNPGWGRRLVLTATLVLLSFAVVIILVAAFTPLADAAGGCGGG